MRKGIILGVVLLFAIGLGGSSLGQAISICDYVPPVNRFAALTISGDYRYFNDRYFDNLENVELGHLTLQGLAWAEGPGWSYSVGGAASLKASPLGVTLDPTLDSEGSLRRYVDDELFIFGGADTVGLPAQAGLTVNLLGGAGWGRFKDVTPLAKALRVVDVLLELGVLAEAPPQETYLSLAEAIGKEPEIGLSGVLKEIETVIGAELGMEAVLALEEVLVAELTRFCGWEVRAAVGYELIDPVGPREALLAVGADYALALGPRAEILAGADLRAPFPQVGAYSFQASLIYQRLLSPTADLNTVYRYIRVRDAGGVVEESHALDLTLGLQIRVDLNAFIKGHLGWGTPGFGFEEAEWGIDLGFEYDLF